MWSLVKEGVIEKIYYSPKSMILDNVRYPSNMFTLYTKEEKKRINIYDIKRKEHPNHNFYNISSSSYTWNASEEIVDEDFTITEKDLVIVHRVDTDIRDNYRHILKDFDKQVMFEKTNATLSNKKNLPVIRTAAFASKDQGPFYVREKASGDSSKSETKAESKKAE